MTNFDFTEAGADDLAQQFIEDGYVILPAENKDALNCIRQCIAEYAARAIGEDAPNDIDGFLNSFHKRISLHELNAIRLKVIEGLNLSLIHI